MNRYTIPLPEALQLAAKRRADRYDAFQKELDELVAVGCTLTINAAQLMRLEDAGLLYDFETGLCEDFTTAPDNPHRALSVAEVKQRQPFHTEVAQTVPAAPGTEFLQELTREMTATI